MKSKTKRFEILIGEVAIADERHGSSSDRWRHGPQSGWTLLPAPVARLLSVRPSRSAMVIVQVRRRSQENARWRPLGDHDGYSQDHKYALDYLNEPFGNHVIPGTGWAIV